MFLPRQVFFHRDALGYELGMAIMEKLRRWPSINIQITETSKPRLRQTGIKAMQKYVLAKKTLVVAVRRTLNFQTCKPSAHFQLPLVSSCPGLCDYCYLQTTLGPSPYVTVYVNVDEILSRAQQYTVQRSPEHTLFEAAATGDPVPVEPLTGVLARAISFFAGQEKGGMRVATKFTDVEGLLGLNHRGRTHFRFSVNTPALIARFDRGTPDLDQRLTAARRLAENGYPVGLIVAPVFPFDNWEKEYEQLSVLIQRSFSGIPDTPRTIEFITHRFTPKAKRLILDRNPATSLPLDEKERMVRMGQFGYLKYVYPSEVTRGLKETITEIFVRRFPATRIEYFV